jgi:prevent-host-death family protein
MTSMASVNIHEAKTHLSRLLERVAAGEEIIIAKAGTSVAKLTSIHARKTALPYGLLKSRLKIKAGFDDPLPDDFIAGFEGR